MKKNENLHFVRKIRPRRPEERGPPNPLHFQPFRSESDKGANAFWPILQLFTQIRVAKVRKTEGPRGGELLTHDL